MNRQPANSRLEPIKRHAAPVGWRGNRRWIGLLVSTLVLSFAGCATHETRDMLNSRIGSMNYEEALQRFGAPTRCAEAGSTKTCTWIYGSGGVVYAPVGNAIVGIPTNAPGARLTFTNGVLSSWRLTGKWK